MSTTYLLIANRFLARIWRSKSCLLSFREIARVENPPVAAVTPASDPLQKVDYLFEVPRFETIQNPKALSIEERTLSFAKSLAERLIKEFTDGSFDELVLVAEPRFLSVLREMLPVPLKNIVRETIREDLSEQSEFEIKRTLKHHFSPPPANGLAFR
jgi:hypothetical protein